MSGTVQVHTVDGILVCLHNSLDTVALRVEDITVQCKAVISSRVVWWNRRTKAKGWDLLIVVIVLENVTNRFYSVEVLILLKVKVM